METFNGVGLLSTPAFILYYDLGYVSFSAMFKSDFRGQLDVFSLTFINFIDLPEFFELQELTYND